MKKRSNFESILSWIFTKSAKTFSIKSPSLSEFRIFLKSVAYRTATKQLIFCPRNEVFFYISQILSKLSKYSFGSKLKKFLSRNVYLVWIFKNASTESAKKADLGPIFPGLCSTDFNDMHHSGLRRQRAFHKNVSVKLENSI